MVDNQYKGKAFYDYSDLQRSVGLNSNNYYGDYINDKASGKGRLTSCNPQGKIEFIYQGEFAGNKPEGKGVCTFYQEGVIEKYEGQWEDGKKHGIGIYHNKKGTKYIGEWQRNQKHGRAILINKDGGVFIGKFADGIPFEGSGTIKDAKGNIYSGELKDGKFTGECAIDLGGVKYIGGCINDKKNGYGKLFLGDRSYEGEFRDDKMHGFGVLIEKNGKIFIGEWKNNKKNGYSRSYHNKEQYEGEYQEDKKHGKGIFINSEGKQFLQIWEQDQLLQQKEIKQQRESGQDGNIHKAIKQKTTPSNNVLAPSQGLDFRRLLKNIACINQ